MTDKLIIYECMNKKCGYCFPNPAICPHHDGIITINHKCCPRCKSKHIERYDTVYNKNDYGMGDL